MPTVAFGTKHSTLLERRSIPKLTSRSLNYARAFAFVCAGMGMLLTGCDGSNYENPDSTAGSIIKGPIIGADVEITDSNGVTVATFGAGNDSRFSVKLPKSAAYPLIATVIGGTDSMTGESPPAIQLRSAILHSGQTTLNFNPFTTLIVAAAEQSDQGLSIESIRSAQSMFSDHPFGLHSELAANPLQTPVNEQNVAELIKASETVAEVLRRTSNSLGITIVDAIQKLGADLADGTINGKGAAGTDPELAVVTNTATAQVLVESLTGTLTIIGSPFDKSVLQTATKLMFPEETSKQQTTAIAPTHAVLKQASMATDVALAVTEHTAFRRASAALNATTPDTQPQENAIVAALNAQGTTPRNVSRALGNATRSAPSRPSAKIANANGVVNKWFPVADTDDSEPARVADNSPPNSEPTPPKDNVPPPSDPSTPIEDTEPRAIEDTKPTRKHHPIAEVKQGRSTPIDVLGFYKGLKNKPIKLKITTKTEKSVVARVDNGQVIYQSRDDVLGSDNVGFKITDADGDSVLGTLAITITCPKTACDRVFSASWRRVPGATGYCLYHRNQQGKNQNRRFEGEPSNHPLIKGKSDKELKGKGIRKCVGDVTQALWKLPVYGTSIFAVTTVSDGVESVFSKEEVVVSFE